MENQLDSYLGYFGLIHDAIKYLSTGTSHFEPSAFDMFSSNIKTGSMLTKNAINYIDEQIRITQVEYKNAYVEGVISKIKDIDRCLFANYDIEGVYVYNDDTKRRNLSLLPERTTNPESPQEVYLANCISSIRAFYVEFVSLCAKYKINIDKYLKKADITIVSDIQDISNKKLHPKRLSPGLTNTQLDILFDLLVKNEFIQSNTDRNGFIWAFGGRIDGYYSFKIAWQKKKNLAVYLIDVLCYDQSSSTHIWEIGSLIFDIKNMAQIKDGYFNTSREKPIGGDIIDEIVDKVRGAV